MAADSGLGELEDRTNFIDGELVPFEDEEHAAPRGVGKGGHAIEDRWGGNDIHPYIRI